eukprot:569630-Rhodomonas_salina.1
MTTPTVSLGPVPRASAMCTIVLIAAADSMHLHLVDWEQAFIQGKWAFLPEGSPAIFIRPPIGWDGASEHDANTVFKVTKPLYGHPAAARCLHFTVDEHLAAEGFVKAGFEESVWVWEAGGKYSSKIVVGIHINDSLIACASADLGVLESFKQALFQRFKGTNEGEVHEYLGCTIKRNWVHGLGPF